MILRNPIRLLLLCILIGVGPAYGEDGRKDTEETAVAGARMGGPDQIDD